MRYIIDAVNKGLEMPFAEACQYEATLFGLVASTDDMNEGTRAFLEKRKAGVQGTVGARARLMQATRSRSGRAAGFRFAVVVSKYNDFVTDRLQAGALAALAAAGVAPSDITLVRVPGAFEIPLAAQHARRERPVRRDRLPRLPDPRRDGALRVHRVGRRRTA